jgi:hypothetical protein
MFKVKTKNAPIVKNNPIFVIEICKSPSIGASKLMRFRISN